ncbi:MAG TPA: peptidoglycan editing factor PgeF [Candidatus Binatia bacterium]|jgi:YfiH family protein
MDMVSLQVPSWQKHTGLLHGFMGRRGGKSVGLYQGLNVSYRVGDDPKVVSQNVCDMKLAIGIHDGRVVTMKQMHGDDIIEVMDTNLKEAGEADAMVTAKPGVFLGVLTADCVPILFVAPKERLVAAVHAGWRGTLGGLAAKAVNYFAGQYNVAAGSLEAALGPSIGACCYEVGDDVVEPLCARWGKLAHACVERSGVKPHLDLRRLNRAILGAAGLPAEHIFELGPCTSCAADDYFSYRRERKETGRQMSVIGWQG